MQKSVVMNVVARTRYSKGWLYFRVKCEPEMPYVRFLIKEVPSLSSWASCRIVVF